MLQTNRKLYYDVHVVILLSDDNIPPPPPQVSPFWKYRIPQRRETKPFTSKKTLHQEMKSLQ